MSFPTQKVAQSCTVPRSVCTTFGGRLPRPSTWEREFRAPSTKEVSQDRKPSASPRTHAPVQIQIRRWLKQRLVRQGRSAEATIGCQFAPTTACSRAGTPRREKCSNKETTTWGQDRSRQWRSEQRRALAILERACSSDTVCIELTLAQLLNRHVLLLLTPTAT